MILESTFHYAAVGLSILLHFYGMTITELITEKDSGDNYIYKQEQRSSLIDTYSF